VAHHVDDAAPAPDVRLLHDRQQGFADVRVVEGRSGCGREHQIGKRAGCQEPRRTPLTTPQAQHGPQLQRHVDLPRQAALGRRELTLDEVALDVEEPLTPVQVIPLQRAQLAQPKAGSECAQHESEPLREAGLRRFEERVHFVARVGVDHEPLGRVRVTELPLQPPWPQRGVSGQLAVLNGFAEDRAQRADDARDSARPQVLCPEREKERLDVWTRDLAHLQGSEDRPHVIL